MSKYSTIEVYGINVTMDSTVDKKSIELRAIWSTTKLWKLEGKKLHYQFKVRRYYFVELCQLFFSRMFNCKHTNETDQNVTFHGQMLIATYEL
jgi:hypothetical protein